jgi:hypothetical protein
MMLADNMTISIRPIIGIARIYGRKQAAPVINIAIAPQLFEGWK